MQESMKKQLPVLLISMLLLFFSTFCYAQTGDTTEFRKEIPTDVNGDADLSYKLTQQKVKQLKIDSLQTGYDSLQIRVWYDYSLSDVRKLLIIKRTNSSWTAASYIMSAVWNASNFTETVKTKKIEVVNPKNGWDNFLHSLFALGIETLPNMTSIPGLSDKWTDGISYHIEIATQKQYRFYSYHLPDKFKDEFQEAKNMVSILKLVEKEFGITCGIK
jgi:hypothetical protein